MSFKIYDDEIKSWGKIVNEELLKEHESTVANSNNLGHVRVDDNTIKVDNNGVIQVSDTFLNSLKDASLTEAKDYTDTMFDNLESTLTETSIRVSLSSGQSSIPIEHQNYTPSTYILFLFDNTTKVIKDEYSISTSDTSPSGYQINLVNPPSENKTFEIVLIHGKAVFNESTIDSRFFDGSTPPSNRSLIWNKTSQ